MWIILFFFSKACGMKRWGATREAFEDRIALSTWMLLHHCCVWGAPLALTTLSTTTLYLSNTKLSHLTPNLAHHWPLMDHHCDIPTMNHPCYFSSTYCSQTPWTKLFSIQSNLTIIIENLQKLEDQYFSHHFWKIQSFIEFHGWLVLSKYYTSPLEFTNIAWCQSSLDFTWLLLETALVLRALCSISVLSHSR